MANLFTLLSPSTIYGEPSNGAQPIGFVSIRARISTTYQAENAYTPCPYVRASLNGRVKARTPVIIPEALEAQSWILSPFDVSSLREVVACDTMYFPRENEEKILGTVVVNVGELLNEELPSNLRLHHYTVQEPKGQITVEYRMTLHYFLRKNPLDPEGDASSEDE
ncbi:hypothetical protein M407DRAFT_245595 [Tulasnella calospora MUT 4182]|uniref:Uncharacterized protein n=1 Tax=Tulasnella calospora MUT 4182 TaxID=1051891 RepID=A0A0C3LI12_9AGAM|nr:hypothetical protein M407DRAFT_245595 [Tulasnella calospora MUT 4182]